jgi:hypothetical protein
MANPKKHYITAKYDFAVDATGTGSYPRTVTLANTDTLPNNAVVNEVCLYASTAVAGSSSTFAVNAGGVNVTAAIAEAKLSDEAVVATDDVKAGGKATADGDIKVVVGTAALTAGVVDITVGYFIGYAE